jgi:ABC-2 type transport system permease protein
MKHVLIVLHKEWLEHRRDRNILFATLIPPLVLTMLPLAIGYAIGHAPPQMDAFASGRAPVAAGNNPALAGMTLREVEQALTCQQLSVLFFLMPLVIPSAIAAYAIVGEKTRRTLEPLLATPVRTWELLLGKMLASLIPAIAITWLAGGIFIAGMWRVSLSARVFAAVVSPGWLLILLLCTPMLALITVASMVVISSRVNDPRTAQQVSAFVVIPFMAVFFGQLSGLLVLSPGLVLGAGVALALIAALSVWLVTRLFQREAILTRWR